MNKNEKIAYMVLGTLCCLTCFGLACSLFAAADELNNSSLEFGTAFRGTWFILWSIFAILSYFVPNPKLIVLVQGSAAFLSLAALALAGERVDFFDFLSESQQAVVVFGFITFVFLLLLVVLLVVIGQKFPAAEVAPSNQSNKKKEKKEKEEKKDKKEPV